VPAGSVALLLDALRPLQQFASTKVIVVALTLPDNARQQMSLS
jgi:hypothetical protein